MLLKINFKLFEFLTTERDWKFILTQILTIAGVLSVNLKDGILILGI